MAAAHKPGHMGTREAHTTALWAQVGAGRAGGAKGKSGKHLKQDQLVLAPRSVGNGTPWRHLRNECGNGGCDWMWSVWRRCQQGSWTLAVRALQRRSRGMRRRTRAGRSAGMLAGEVLTPNISARRQAQQSTLRRPRDGLGMRGGSSRPLRTQPKCTSRRGHRHRRGASCRCAGAARAAKRPAVRSTRRPRPASCTRTLWGTSGRTRRSPQSCETGTGGAGRARGRCRCASFGLSVLSRGAIYHRESADYPPGV